MPGHPCRDACQACRYYFIDQYGRRGGKREELCIISITVIRDAM
uniref:Uncharacterized protein n=1 Tax=Anguilla anguilla TaxID=7936 RepID=A0A0E9PKC4_ANGAN